MRDLRVDGVCKPRMWHPGWGGCDALGVGVLCSDGLWGSGKLGCLELR